MDDPTEFQFWHQEVGGIFGVADSNDQFGMVLAAGRAGRGGDADSFADLAIGVNDGALGAVNAIYGTEGGLDAAGNQQWLFDDAGAHPLGPPGAETLNQVANRPLEVAPVGDSGDDERTGVLALRFAARDGVVATTVDDPAADTQFAAAVAPHSFIEQENLFALIKHDAALTERDLEDGDTSGLFNTPVHVDGDTIVGTTPLRTVRPLESSPLGGSSRVRASAADEFFSALGAPSGPGLRITDLVQLNP